ncbi:3-oxoacyl-reductase [Macrophomina phaseolina]|uniref:3-oxoacyl-reductase n=1 Tax=Macrophomina phaseolina TaxID=35725 RepID=A0ABQ8FTG1_9PEZI|nr:3-oxoacyl-reductase [Macrophomina phaseolina]
MADLKAETAFSIPGRVAVITGGAGGLGTSVARCFLTNGASVTLVDVSASALESTKSALQALKTDFRLPGSISTVQGDLSTSEGVKEVANKILSTHETLDILIHAAGIRVLNGKTFEPGNSLESLVEATNSLAWEDMERSFRINVMSQYYLTAELLSLLGAAAKKNGGRDGRGCVICFSSAAGRHNAQFVPAYQLTKAAVDHLVRIMAAEFADHYIRVNAIAPGIFPSGMCSIDKNDPNSNIKLAFDMPARRPASEMEMAASVLYLASPAGAYTTGHHLVADGGRLLVAAGRISKPKL